MKYYFQTITLLILLLNCNALTAQEFNLSVKVSAPALKTADPKIMEALQNELEGFFNNNQWTEDTFEEHEKIQGNIQLTITEDISATSFKAELVVQTSRPVYNSSYSTQTMRYLDRSINFSYDGLRPLQQTKEGYIDNFSSILSFYAYYMLAVDYDSFSNLGGDPFYDLALNIYNNLPNSIQRGDSGWAQDDKRQQNRYFLLESARSPRFRRYREAFYTYHRQGLDKMYDDVVSSRQVILQAVTDVGRVNKETNNTILPKMFSDTKRIELLDIFLVADPDQKTKIRNIMISIDPTQTEALRDLR
ncbi:MAG: DUF4835 family protein [Saprospiraceae bacterium]|nr:DUF4835 family protein [Saprospiraceae bacterium]